MDVCVFERVPILIGFHVVREIGIDGAMLAGDTGACSFEFFEGSARIFREVLVTEDGFNDVQKDAFFRIG